MIYIYNFVKFLNLFITLDYKKEIKKNKQFDWSLLRSGQLRNQVICTDLLIQFM